MNRQTELVANAAVALNVPQSFDIIRDGSAQIAFNDVIRVDDVTEYLLYRIRQIFRTLGWLNNGRNHNNFRD